MCNGTYFYRALLNYMEHITLLLDGTIKALRSLPDSQISLARQSLTCQPLKMSGKKQRRRNYIITSTAKNIPHVTNKDGILAPGLLPYVLEEIMPTIEVQHILDNLVYTTYVIYLGAVWALLRTRAEKSLNYHFSFIKCK